MIIFEGFFKLIDYNVSHKLLLIRNTEIEKNEINNCDILFIGVYYLDIPENFESISINEANESDYNIIEEKCHFKVYRAHQKLFRIESSGKKYYIGCTNYKVEKNNLNPLESSIKIDL